MHVTLPPEPGNGQALTSEEVFMELSSDPIWRALQQGGAIQAIAPHFSEDEVRRLIERLREPKMLERLQDLLSSLPAESQQLLDQLQEHRLQNA